MASGKGARLTMNLDEEELRQYLKEMMRRGMDLRVYWKRLGAWMAYRSVDKTFRVRGRPKWKKLGDYTIAMRRWRATSKNAPSPRPAFTRKILEVSGDLRDSFTFVARKKELVVGTNYPGSDVHQFGKTIKAPRRWKRATVEVKKRQLIGIHPEDEKKGEEFMVWHLKKLIPGAK